VIKNFDFALTNEVQGLVQRIKQSVLFIKGEWFFNEELGTEYYPYIADKDLDVIKEIIADAIRNVEGVNELISFVPTINNATRIMNIEFEVTDNLGNSISDIATTNLNI
jgi:hypothetical protein